MSTTLFYLLCGVIFTMVAVIVYLARQLQRQRHPAPRVLVVPRGPIDEAIRQAKRYGSHLPETAPKPAYWQGPALAGTNDCWDDE